MDRNGRNVRVQATFRWLAPAIACALLMLPVDALACPGCKENAAQSAAGLADGFGYSIYGMVLIPFLLVATVATVVIRAYRRVEPGSSPSDSNRTPSQQH